VAQIKFLPQQTRLVVDVAKLRKLAESESKMPDKRRAGEFVKPKSPIKKPKVKITVDEHWRVTFTDGNHLSVPTESPMVKENFTPKFLEELKRARKGFVDIPVGDYKSSHLHLHPHLKIVGAPRIRFMQEENEDLCVSNSIASAFDTLGFDKEAWIIAEFGKAHMAGGTVDALDNVVQFARDVLPTWIQPKRKPLAFDWRQDLDCRTVFVGVLLASDGNSSHAITIHGGFIYDSNEVVALPLCQEALDYCTSTETQKSTFVEFRRGWSFRYTGKQQNKMKQMTLPNNR
jgi:hypothetical protein